MLKTALTAAKINQGNCAPNPAVGAVITNTAGEIQSIGTHQGPGYPHAEIDALQKINYAAQGMTLYITLEPCSHFGKTPPCTDAIIRAGIKRVVYAYQDPNPIVSGKSAALLTQANIQCEHVPLPEINTFYQSYSHWHQTKRPFITVKMAMTLDGKIAAEAGKRVQITGAPLQEITHLYRKNTDAILTTAETIKNDNPQLNARYQNQIISKHLYLLDTHLSISPTAEIFKTTRSVTLFHAHHASPKNKEKFGGLAIRFIPIETDPSGLHLNQVIEYIGAEGIHDLWIEAGGKCFSAFLNQKLIQRALIYIAPHCLGAGIPAFQGSDLSVNPKTVQWQQMGKDGLLEMLF